MQLLVRLDDITADMDMSRFLRIKGILDRYGIKPLIGVVPDNHDQKLHCADDDPDFWIFINELISEGWVVSQHGYKHTYSSKDSGLLGINPFSEFAGVSYDDQLQLLSSGQQILLDHGISTGIFMAPGHSFDKNTLKALKNLGFKAVTDGLYKKPYIRGGLLFIPCRLLNNKCSDFDTLCIHSNTISDNSINDLEELFSKDDTNIISWNIETLREVAVRYNAFIYLYEKIAIIKRRLRNYVANNKRLALYMQNTYDPNKIVRIAKRVFLFPIIFVESKPKP